MIANNRFIITCILLVIKMIEIITIHTLMLVLAIDIVNRELHLSKRIF